MIRFGPKAETPELKPAAKAEKPAAVLEKTAEAPTAKPAAKRKKSKDSGGETLL